MAGRQLDRLIDVFRRRRPTSGTALALTTRDLSSESDREQLRSWIDHSIAGRGGEAAARRRAGDVVAAFLDLDTAGQHRFLALLADEYGHDRHEVDTAMAEVAAATDGQRHHAEQRLRQALRPRRSTLLRRILGLNGGLAFTIELRESLIDIRNERPELRQLDEELRTLLNDFFDLTTLELEHLDWDTPASLLEKLIEYEAVHTIESWDDLKRRLGPGRRCYAFTHHSLPGEPLIFVEVALTRGLASNITDLLDPTTERVAAASANTAIFYSISNCHPGLAGVSLGDLLIKRVATLLKAELSGIETFATLSPIPGLRRWLAVNEPELIAELDAVSLDDRMRSIEPWRDTLLEMTARYLLEAKRPNGAVSDPVANFHLSNGAIVERLNWLGNPTTTGWERSLGMMVNYRYDLAAIETNHDRYDAEYIVAASDAVRRLAASTTTDRSN
ncbi:MAG: malonyl-CoA decarboxylase family protein [Acidimicrobiales bacterium]